MQILRKRSIFSMISAIFARFAKKTLWMVEKSIFLSVTSYNCSTMKEEILPHFKAPCSMLYISFANSIFGPTHVSVCIKVHQRNWVGYKIFRPKINKNCSPKNPCTIFVQFLNPHGRQRKTILKNYHEMLLQSGELFLEVMAKVISKWKIVI